MQPQRSMTERVKLFLAYVIRIISIPPVMVCLLVLVLALFADGFFNNEIDIAAMLICLALIPLAAYPLSWMIPCVRKKGREGQRNLAFVLSLSGYVLGWLYAKLFSTNRHQIFVYTIYLLSVLLLLLWNKVFHLRASGHGCSVTGPVVLSGYYLGLAGIIIGAVCYLSIFWASVTAKRHKWDEFLGGSVLCIFACGLAWLVCHYYQII